MGVLRIISYLGVIVLFIGVGIGILPTLFPSPIDYREKYKATEDKWWGKGSPKKDTNKEVRPFTINVEETLLDALKISLQNTRYFDSIEGVGWDYGTPPNFTKELVEYWRTQYDWRENEKILNQYNHFKTNIYGIDVHFIHVKAKNNPNAKPLLLVHGWPGSFYEFYDIIPMLSDPKKYGGVDSDAFDLVIPSIPGYGFSEQPHQPGFHIYEAALLFSQLMQRLGYNKFLYQGGDWGAIIGLAMTRVDPIHCTAIHLNMIMTATPPFAPIQLLLGPYLPHLVIRKDDQAKLLPVSKFLAHQLRESGYMHLQGTRPYSLGQALTDSPAGFAAYISEKFFFWGDCSGDVYKRFPKEKLLTNIMLYWVTNTMTSGIAFYKESIAIGLTELLAGEIDFPVALAEFPVELSPPIRSWVESYYKNIISYTVMERGGHFAAMEEPLLLAQDLWKFNKLVTLESSTQQTKVSS